MITSCLYFLKQTCLPVHNQDFAPFLVHGLHRIPFSTSQTSRILFSTAQPDGKCHTTVSHSVTLRHMKGKQSQKIYAHLDNDESEASKDNQCTKDSNDYDCWGRLCEGVEPRGNVFHEASSAKVQPFHLAHLVVEVVGPRDSTFHWGAKFSTRLWIISLVVKVFFSDAPWGEKLNFFVDSSDFWPWSSTETPGKRRRPRRSMAKFEMLEDVWITSLSMEKWMWGWSMAYHDCYTRKCGYY